MRVLRPAKEIADRSQVTKRTEEKVYRLTRAVYIYKDQTLQTTVRADPGKVFLVGADATVNEISDDTSLLQEIPVEIPACYTQQEVDDEPAA